MSKLTNPAAAPDVEFFHYDPEIECLHLPDGTPITKEVTEQYAAFAESRRPSMSTSDRNLRNVALQIREQVAAAH